ncbi:MAG: 30S ribosomal protein S5 [Neisseriaceae bacterium]
MVKKVTEERGDGLLEKMVAVNRVTKVVKGGRIMSFAALVVVGNADGQVGMGKGKAKEVPLALQKAKDQARKNMISVPLDGRTIHHEVTGKNGATKVFMQPAKEGSGVKAGGPMRTVFDVLGVHNVSAKIHGSTNPYNIVRATLDALMKLKTPDEIARKRGLSVEAILGRSGHER